MSREKKTGNKQSSKSLPRKKSELKSSKKSVRISNWETVEGFLIKHDRKIVILLVLLFSFFGLALFDVLVSVAGDDATYIERAYNLVHYGEITFYQGPLYPAILGIGVAIFGINLVALKSMSFLFMLGQEILFYFTFKKRIPFLLLFLVMFLIATNLFVQYYSSQTYTEAAFMFLQALSLFVIFKLIDLETSETKWMENTGMWLLYGFLVLLLSLCKSIAIVCFLPLIIYFLLQKRWRSATKAFAAFLFWKIVYEFSMSTFYRTPDVGQFKQILLKDLYHPALGYETIPGLINRFFQNANTYFSVNLVSLLSLKNSVDATILLTIVVAILLTIAFIYIYRKNKYLFFVALYSIILYGGIFLGIQASNRQARLIIIVLPFTYFFVLGAGYYFSRVKSRWGIAIISLVIIGTFLQLKNMFEISALHLPVLKRNLKGDIYSGHTPDWINYIKLSSWCGENLPDTALVACRKGSISFIYSKGKKFYEINQAPDVPNPDSTLAALKKIGVTHFLIAKIRTNPLTNDGQVINTMHKIAVPILKKYPDKLKYIIGFGKEEEAVLYQIIY